MDDCVDIYVKPNTRGRYLCVFVIDFGDWTSEVRFTPKRRWIQDLSLQLIYKWGEVESVTADRDVTYPPIIKFKYPRSKLKVLSALRYVKAKHRDKLLRLFKSDLKKFEEEVIVTGIAESIGK